MLSKEKIKQLSKLKTKKEREKQGRFLIEGLRLCEEAANSSWPIESVLYTTSFEEKSKGKNLLKKLHQSNAILIQVKSQTLSKLSDTVTAQGIVCVAKAKRFPVKDLWERKIKLIIALDGIRDPGNVGTLIRAADAFDVDGILLSGDTVELFNPKLVRSTMGAIFRIRIFEEVDLEKTLLKLKERKFKIVGTDVKSGKSLDKFFSAGKICLLIGGEAEGLNENLLKLSDEIIHIPTGIRSESLNVAVAGGILLYEIKRRFTGKKGDGKSH
jgi:TrmH family RNA methyltransferase